MTDEEWFENHTAEDDIPESTVTWLMRLTPAAQETARKFPPSCVVKTKKGVNLFTPQPGKYGTVASITMDGTELKINPVNDGGADPAGMCIPEQLEVVGYWRGLTPEKVANILNTERN